MRTAWNRPWHASCFQVQRLLTQLRSYHMLHKFWKTMARFGCVKFPKDNRKFPSRQVTPTLEQLCERRAPAVTASFVPGAGSLAVFGDAAANSITISRDA